MPKRTDLRTILIIGSGPIVIGQGCEFDYSGTQACKALREEGYRVVLVNSNPATIMTDPEFADRTYIEPITAEAVTKIIAKEHAGEFPIDALLPTLGGQTALNTACRLYDDGVLDKYGVEMIGATREVIYRAEDRKLFKEIVEGIGLKMPRAGIANSMPEAWDVLETTGLPAIIRPAFTLGGTGGGIAYNREEFEDIARRGLDASMNHQILIDQSVIGWKEYELEVMRDRDDNVVIICAIENVDPMGVHTGDSITVAPAQTLTDREYQRMRDAAMAIIRVIGVETGGCNIQFAINPRPTGGVEMDAGSGGSDGRGHLSDHAGGARTSGGSGGAEGEMVVVEMNPRVSRSSALASKATGFAIAKIAAKLAVGYTLPELPNDITKKTVACFEPTIDYVVTKIPRWTFEKFPEADETLTTQMKSVGEAMSIGRTFKESLQKGIRSMEVKRFGLGLDNQDKWLAERRRGSRLEGARLEEEKSGVASSSSLAPQAPSPSSSQRLGAEKRPGDDHFASTRSGDAPAAAGGSLPASFPIDETKLRRKLSVPSQGRLYYLRYAFKMGWSIDAVHELTRIDPWFLDQIKQLVDFEDELARYARLADAPRETLFQAKQLGYSDAQLANLYLGKISSATILEVRAHRQRLGIHPVYKLVDTCAAEFEAATPYYYSTYESPIVQIGDSDRLAGAPGGAQRPSVSASEEVEVTSPVCYMDEIEDAATTAPPGVADDEIRVTPKKKIIILGGGPNRIGQGIEFDYCCVQAAFAARELGYEAVMINSNPETVSTDYDTSDLLFFEPLTLEDVLNVCERLNGGPFRRGLGSGVEGLAENKSQRPPSHSSDPSPQTSDPAPNLVHGVIVQFGGQTPLNLAQGLELAGVPIIGTSVDSIDLAGNRERFAELLKTLGIRQPENGIAFNTDQAVAVAKRIGYPVLVRPSFVLGGRAMETVFDDAQLRHYMAIALGASDVPDQPILIDKFLSEAIECDVDVIADFESAKDEVRSAKSEKSPPSDTSNFVLRTSNFALVAGVMEHIEEAGIHSGDSACAIPPYSLPAEVVEQVKEQSRKLAEALRVRGLMNVQYAIKRPDPESGRGYEVYVLEVNPRASRTVPFVSKATGVPWARLAAKVMAGESLAGLGVTEEALPAHTSVKESVFPFSKFPGVDVILGPEMRSTGEVMGIDPGFPLAFAKSQMAAGTVLPTAGKVFLSVRESDKGHIVEVARRLAEMGFEVVTTAGTHDYLAAQGVKTGRVNKISEGRPNAVDLIKNRELALIINTPSRKGIKTDEGRLRSTAVRFNVPMITTTTGAAAAVQAIAALRGGKWGVRALQDYFPAEARNRGTVPS